MPHTAHMVDASSISIEHLEQRFNLLYWTGKSHAARKVLPARVRVTRGLRSR
jgi:hypothetical protein